MKNIILLSTILAAGTLCAGASTILTTTYTSPIPRSSSQTVTVDGQEVTYSAGTIRAGEKITGTNLADDGVSLSYSVTGGNPGWLPLKDASSSQSVLIPWINLCAQANYGWLITNTYASGSAAALGSIDGITLSLSAFEASSNIASIRDEASSLVVNLTVTVYDGTTSKGTFTGTWDLSAVTGSSTSDYETNFANQTITLSGGSIDTSSFTDDLKIEIKALSTAAVTTTTNGETKVSEWTFIGLNSITVIPEPSLFGLLAGTLALGLAGTRRRRRGNVK